MASVKNLKQLIMSLFGKSEEQVLKDAVFQEVTNRMVDREMRRNLTPKQVPLYEAHGIVINPLSEELKKQLSKEVEYYQRHPEEYAKYIIPDETMFGAAMQVLRNQRRYSH